MKFLIAFDKNNTLFAKVPKAKSRGLNEGDDYLKIDNPEYTGKKQLALLYPDTIKCLLLWFNSHENIQWVVVSSGEKVNKDYIQKNLISPLFGNDVKFDFDVFGFTAPDQKLLSEYKQQLPSPDNKAELSDRKDIHIRLLMNKNKNTPKDFKKILLVDDKQAMVQLINSQQEPWQGIQANGIKEKDRDINYLIEVAKLTGLWDLATTIFQYRTQDNQAALKQLKEKDSQSYDIASEFLASNKILSLLKPSQEKDPHHFWLNPHQKSADCKGDAVHPSPTIITKFLG